MLLFLENDGFRLLGHLLIYCEWWEGKLNSLGLSLHGWWQREKGQHQPVGFREYKSGRATADAGSDMGNCLMSTSNHGYEFFFSVLLRIIWSFLFCSVMCLANQPVPISLPRSINLYMYYEAKQHIKSASSWKIPL